MTMFLRAKGNMQLDQASGREIIIVTEMPEELPIDTISETTRWLQSWFRGECGSPASWKNSSVCVPAEALVVAARGG